MHTLARAAMILLLTTGSTFLGAAPARAEGEIPTGTVVGLSSGGEGTYIDETGDSRSIFTGRLRNESGSDLTVIYTLSLRAAPEIGSDYQVGVPSSVATFGLYTAHWLARRHLEEIGTPLSYWPEREAVQLCIWHVSSGFELDSSHVPNRTVLGRAIELCKAVEAADPESAEEYFSAVQRRVDLRLNVRRATATRVFLAAELKDAELNEPMPDRPISITYDGSKTEERTGDDGVIRLEYERSDEAVYFDALYKSQLFAGNAWISVDGTQPPVVTSDPVPVDHYEELEIKPKDLASKEDLAYQALGRVFGVTGATVGLVIVFGGWLLNPVSWLLGRWSGRRAVEQ